MILNVLNNTLDSTFRFGERSTEGYLRAQPITILLST